ncbi:KPN_01571 family protein [Escherichia coli]|nr:KPN_01571 family protein [Escherichia coli]
MNPFIWVLIILMTLDALRELAGASSIFRMAINVGLSWQ